MTRFRHRVRGTKSVLENSTRNRAVFRVSEYLLCAENYGLSNDVTFSGL